jgi:hypothetical protein
MPIDRFGNVTNRPKFERRQYLALAMVIGDIRERIAREIKPGDKAKVALSTVTTLEDALTRYLRSDNGGFDYFRFTEASQRLRYRADNYGPRPKRAKRTPAPTVLSWDGNRWEITS